MDGGGAGAGCRAAADHVRQCGSVVPHQRVRVQCQYQRAVSVFEAGGHGQVGAEPHDLHPAAAVGVSLAGHRYPESDADHRQRRGGGLLLSHPSADAHQLPWLRLRPHEEHDGLYLLCVHRRGGGSGELRYRYPDDHMDPRHGAQRRIL